MRLKVKNPTGCIRKLGTADLRLALHATLDGLSGDPAVLVSLAPGVYTVQASGGAGAQSGVVSAEIYEVR